MRLADQLEEVNATIYGLTKILEDDGCRYGADGEQPVFTQFEQGIINTAIKQLTYRIDAIAEAVDRLEGQP
nr:hypothetical protein [Halomonas socia]